MLDKENTKIGYLCGRIIAVIELTHDLYKNEDGKVNVSLASQNPQSMIQQFVAVKHCFSGKAKVLENIFQEIIDKISAEGIPEKLELEDQNRFWMGYYHQKKCLYASNFYIETSIEKHKPDPINPLSKENNIDELKK